MVKVISMNEKRGTAQIVVHTQKMTRGKLTMHSQTKHIMFDYVSNMWLDSKLQEVKF